MKLIHRIFEKQSFLFKIYQNMTEWIVLFLLSKTFFIPLVFFCLALYFISTFYTPAHNELVIFPICPAVRSLYSRPRLSNVCLAYRICAFMSIYLSINVYKYLIVIGTKNIVNGIYSLQNWSSMYISIAVKNKITDKKNKYKVLKYSIDYRQIKLLSKW